ncbi:hypothetical protein N7486_003020 [Penicillium sp. IBT 16267x]|nr:hypothetical protein N7486_003020 [Penicillium sp. IBT 16267x]
MIFTDLSSSRPRDEETKVPGKEVEALIPTDVSSPRLNDKEAEAPDEEVEAPDEEAGALNSTDLPSPRLNGKEAEALVSNGNFLLGPFDDKPLTPEPEAIPVENSVIEEINAANILHPFGTYTVPVHQSSLSILDPTPYPLPIARQTSPHRDGEGIQGIVAAFQGLESHRADAFGGPRKVDLPSHPLPRRLKDTDYEIFGGSRKPDLPSHPLPQRLKVADPDAFGGSRKPDCPFSHRVVSSLEHDDSDARFVPSSYQSVIARNPEPFSGKVVNDLNRTAAKKLASEMLEMPLYKNGVYYYIFWTDGSFCRPKTGNEGGAAAVWIDPERQEWHSVREKPLCQPTNSHDTELLGIELALWQASSFIAKFQQDYPSTLNARHEVFVFTDSSASLHMIPRAHLTPLCKDWAREYLLTKILNAGAVLKRLGAHTQLHWVPGHDRVIGNVIADREAKSAAHGDYVGRQVAWGPWRQASPVTLIHTTESHMTEQEMDLVTRFKALVHTDDYVSLL